MADNQRIEDLRRRVEKDPASIAFAQLAEEYRRAGQLQESVAVCHAGLAIHPGYLSARVTLGRAFLELNQLDEAQAELSQVLKSAPENLAAIRGLAEIHHRRGDLAEALVQYRAALSLARNDPDLEQTVSDLTRRLAPKGPPRGSDGLSFEQMQRELSINLQAQPPAPSVPQEPDPAPVDPEPLAAPEEPLDLLDFVEPFELVAPAEPLDLVVPEEPLNLVAKETLDPVVTEELLEFVAPVEPLALVESLEPLELVEPEEPLDLVDVVEPLDLAVPEGPVVPEEPLDLVDFLEPLELVAPAEPLDPVVPEEPLALVAEETLAPVVSEELLEFVAPVEPLALVSVEPLEIVAPEEPSAPVVAEEPLEFVAFVEPLDFVLHLELVVPAEPLFVTPVDLVVPEEPLFVTPVEPFGLVEAEELLEPVREDPVRSRALLTIAALDQWLDAIHAAGFERHP